MGGGGEGESTVRDMAPLSLGNLGTKLSKMSFSHFKTYFTQSLLLSSLDNNNSIRIILLCLQCCLSKMCGPEKEMLSIL